MADKAPRMSEQNRKEVEEAMRMLRATLQGDDRELKSVYKKLGQLQTNQTFNQCLAVILSQMKQAPERIRQAAGIFLKNNIRDSYENMNPSVRNFIKNRVLQTLGDDSKRIRKTVGSIVSQTASKDKLKGWQPVLTYLVKMLDSNNYNHVDGAFGALSKLCEDEPDALDSQELGRPLNILIPKFLTFFKHPREEFRHYALGSVNQFITRMPQALSVHMQDFIAGLFFLTKDKSQHIRRLICQAFVQLLRADIKSLMPYMRKVMDFMLQANSDEKESVALEACEFWSSLCMAHKRRGLDKKILGSYLHALVPVLLKGMVYSPLDLVLLGGDEEDADVPDKDSDIAPRHHSSRFNQADSWDDDDEDASYWNLRKCSASTLDQLATVYKNELLPILLPHLRNIIKSEQKWQVQEAGILALGAIAEGCFSGLEQHLPQLIQFLIAKLQDRYPLVRSITCWTLSRYSKWVVNESKGDDEKYFKPLVVNLLRAMHDKNKKVQDAACSAFACVEEEARGRLVPYLLPIVRRLVQASERYQAKNLLGLFDTIGTLAEAVGPALNQKVIVQTLMPPLMARCGQLKNNDRNIFPLLECLTSLAQALKSGFVPYARPLFNRALQIIQTTLMEQARNGISHVNDSEKEFIVASLDLLGGLTDGLGGTIESLVGNSNLLQLLFACVKDTDKDVRQSAFALLGDLSRVCIGHIKPHLNKFLPVAISAINQENDQYVIMNASWAVGEIALLCGGMMTKYMPALMKNLAKLIMHKNAPGDLLENIATTLGRIALVCPAVVAPDLHFFAKNWCTNLLRIEDDREKEHAYQGLCSVIHKNPKGIVKAIPELVDAIAAYDRPRNSMAIVFKRILVGLKQMLGQEWTKYFRGCDPRAYGVVARRYGL